MSWGQWPGAAAQPGLVASVINPAPAVVNPGLAGTGVPYTAEQWAQMQQQNWQQWAQWQQQFQQWQQQYGAQYAKSMTAITSQTVNPPPLQSSFPTTTPAPPLPAETKPPLPPDDPPTASNRTSYGGYTTAPPNPPPSYTSAPPNQSQGYMTATPNHPPPGYQSVLPPVSQPSPSESNRDQRSGYGSGSSYEDNRGRTKNDGWQNQGQNRSNLYSQPPPGPPGQPPNFSKPPPNMTPGDGNLRSEFGNKRPYNQPPDYGDPKKNRFQQNPTGWQSQRKDNFSESVSQPVGPKPNVEELSEAEKKFDKQFAEWEAQFQKWKDQNANHPDKAQYREYEKKWENWRAQLLERREQMRRKRLGLLGDNKLPQKPNADVKQNQQGFGNQARPQEQNAGLQVQKQMQTQLKPQNQNQLGPQIQNQAGSHIQNQQGLQIQNQPGTHGTYMQNQSMLQMQSQTGPQHTPNIDTNKQNQTAVFNRPPPNLNDEPLQFKSTGEKPIAGKSDEQLSQPAEGDSVHGFLKSTTSSGIPGLDLVKEGNEGDSEEGNRETVTKGPDLAAISKGLDTILGDEQLLNMLNMVSKNTGVKTTPGAMVAPKLTDNYSQNQEKENENSVNEDTSKDDQYYEEHSRNSFADPDPNFRGTDNARDVPESFGQQLENDQDLNKGPNEFETNFDRNNEENEITPDIFNRGFDSGGRGLEYNQGYNQNISNFKQDTDFGREFEPKGFGRGPDGLGRGYGDGKGATETTSFGSYQRGPVGFESNRPFGRGHSDSTGFDQLGKVERAPGNFGRGPSDLGRGAGDFGRGPSDFGRGPSDFGRSPSDFGRGPSDFGRGPSDFGRGPGEFGRGPGDFGRGAGILGRYPGDLRRGSGDLGKGSDDPVGGPNDPARDSGDLGRGPVGLGRDEIDNNPRSFNKGPNSFERGPSNFERGLGNFERGPGSFEKGPDGFERGNTEKSPGNFQRGTNNFQRDLGNYSKGPGNFERGMGSFHKDSNNFEKGPSNFKRGPGSFEQTPSFRSPLLERPPGNFERSSGLLERGSNNFGRGPGSFERGPGNFSRAPDNFENDNQLDRNFEKNSGKSTGLDRGSNYERGPGTFERGPGNVEKGPSNFGRGLGSLERGPDIFDRGNFERSPGNYEKGFGNLDRNLDIGQRGPGNFGKGSGGFGGLEGADDFRKGPGTFGRDLGSFERDKGNFQRGPDSYRNFDRSENFGTGTDMNLSTQAQFQGQNNFNKDLNMYSRGNTSVDRQLNFEPPDRFNDDSNFSNRHQLEPDMPVDKDLPANDLAVPLEEEIWKPEVLIDYDHKSLKQSDVDVLMEPIYTFDYRHKPLNRIPLPQRPNWLKESVKNYPEFDFLISRPFEPQQLRRYSSNDPYRKDDYQYDRRKYDDEPFDQTSDRRSYDDKWKYDDKPYERVQDDRRSIDDRRAYDDRRSHDDRRTHDDRRSYEERRSFENRRSYDDRKSIDDKGPFNERKSYDRRRSPGGELDDKGDYNRKSRSASRSFENEGRRPDYEYSDRKSDNRRSNKMDIEEPRFENWSPSPIRDLPDEKDAKQNIDSGPSTINKNSNITLIEDLLNPPGRYNRPSRIVIILRGPPGSGKTTLAKLIKDREVESGGSAPRILSLDDYFMVEHEKEVVEEGRKVKVRDMVYEYEECMEPSYRLSLMKAFKKTITDGYFSFIIVDNVNDKVKYFGEMWSFAKQNGFQVYICQLELDVQTCTKRNVHGRTEAEIEKCVSGWEPTPSHHPILDATSLIQCSSIPEVEMEEINSPPSVTQEESQEESMFRSKWDSFDFSQDNLAKLDGTSKPLRPSKTMEDYLQLDDEWVQTASRKPGQKRVRWADLEERKEQEKMRAIGFVVGQTNWDRMMDPTMGSSALTQTKFIERTGRY